MWLLECDLPKSLLPLCHQWKRVVKCSQESHNHNNYMVGCDTPGVSHCWKGTQQTPPKEQQYSTAGDRAQLPHTGQTSSWWELTGSDWTQYLWVTCKLTALYGVAIRIHLPDSEVHNECQVQKYCIVKYYIFIAQLYLLSVFTVLTVLYEYTVHTAMPYMS